MSDSLTVCLLKEKNIAENGSQGSTGKVPWAETNQCIVLGSRKNNVGLIWHGEPIEIAYQNPKSRPRVKQYSLQRAQVEGLKPV